MDALRYIPLFFFMAGLILAAPHIAWSEARALVLVCLALAFIFWAVTGFLESRS